MENGRPCHRPAQNQSRRLIGPTVVRLQKFLAEAGVASRRASEAIITSGRVTVNGALVSELGVKIDPARDCVAVDGRALKAKRKLYIALHKPPGFVCTRSDGQARDKIA